MLREGELQRRRSSRRRGVTTLAVVGALVASFSAAGVFALGNGGTPRLIDRTQSCPVPIQGGVPVFHLSAVARGLIYSQETGKAEPKYAQLGVYVEQNISQWTYFESVTDARKGFMPQLDPACKAAPRVVLGPAGLPKEGVYLRNERGLGGDFGYRCFSGARITIRSHVVISSAGAPTSARLIVRTGKKLRPVAYIDWTPNKVTTYLSPDCGPSQ